MLIEQFHRDYKIALDKVDSSAYSEIKPWEIDYFLNEAQARLVKQRYGLNNLYRKGFEQSQKRTDDLKNITVTRYTAVQPLMNQDFFGDTIFRADLDSLFTDELLTSPATEEYMFYLRSMAHVNKDTCSKWGNVNLVQQNDLTTLVDDPFNKPRPENIVVYFEEGDVFATCGSGSIDKFKVTFIKRPVQMNIGTYTVDKAECELSEHVHREILQIAVTITLENIESNRGQSQVVINENKIE